MSMLLTSVTSGTKRGVVWEPKESALFCEPKQMDPDPRRALISLVIPPLVWVVHLTSLVLEVLMCVVVKCLGSLNKEYIINDRGQTSHVFDFKKAYRYIFLHFVSIAWKYKFSNLFKLEVNHWCVCFWMPDTRGHTFLFKWPDLHTHTWLCCAAKLPVRGSLFGA